MTTRTIRRHLILILILLTAALAADAERPSRWEKRDGWQNVPGILAAMGAGRDAWVADIGSRDGYLTFHLAQRVGEGGRVYAVDIDDEALGKLRRRAEKARLRNVTTVHSRPDDPKLPGNTFDAVVIVNAYHEMDEHESMLGHIRRALKPGGRLVVLDSISESYRGKSRSRQTSSHEIDMAFVEKELVQAGFEILQARDPFVANPDDRDEMWLLSATPCAGSCS